MSVNTTEATDKSQTPHHQQRWCLPAADGDTPAVTDETSAIQVNSLTMGELLSAETLKQLARQCHAADQRERKLTCVVFCWLTVLAFGPGGPTTLHQLLSHVVSAMLLAGVGLVCATLSKEALSESFRERPWPFFAAVLHHLLEHYAQLWQQLAGLPNPLVVEPLQVLLIDSTTMKVATKLFRLFPGRATGKRKHWAGVKLHLGWR